MSRCDLRPRCYLPRHEERRWERAGIAFGLAAYGWWGFVPLYFKAVSQVAPLEVLAHRVLWSLVLLSALLAVRGRIPLLGTLLRDRRTLAVLGLTTLLIAANWLVFIWAVANDRVLQASFGYFVTPLLNVLLGVVVLKERLRRSQALAVALAGLGVLWLSLRLGGLPVISLALAASFSLYGLLRKLIRPDGTLGLAAETLLLAPAALAWLLVREGTAGTAFLHDGAGTALLLAAGGIVTALPLIWFAEAARRLRYATVGFLQYLSPTLQFLLAVVLFHEPFTASHAVAFGLIWAALGLYSWDALRHG
ncbi:MAG: EamA family transporter RarD [bacterium]|nr:EamA family transporter RarD [bacterium]